MRHGMGLAAGAIALLAIGLRPGQADEAADVAAIKAAKATLDTAFAKQDTATVKAMMTPDHRAIAFVYQAPRTVDEQIASLPDLKIEVYDATEPTIKLLAPDAALLTLENSYRGTFKGKPLPQRVFVSEIWVRGAGKWLEDFYQETVMVPQ